jgi:lysophospholipase
MEKSKGFSVYVNDVVNSQLDSPASKAMVQSELSRILIIYTGGTIGMQNNPEHGYLPVQGYMTQKLAQNDRFHIADGFRENLVYKSGIDDCTTSVNGIPCKALTLPALTTPPSLFNKKICYSILEYTPLLDSSNMTMSDWVQIATDIEINYELYDAFLVLHGTDTMAYTASALSFILENLGKSVIITGSQVPLSEIRTDALDNLLGALTIAGHFVIPEVGLFFDNKLFRGNRCSKVNAVEFNAFESPNLLPLVTVGINIDVSWEDVWRPRKIARFKAHKNLNPSVATLRLFPGITEATVRAFFSPQIAGVVLETYGSGNAPSNRPDILNIIKEACDSGVVVVNCSQCKKATVTSLYQTGIALFKIGVIPGADMTPECALTKLTYLLGKYKDPTRVRQLMCKNLRGELTMVSKKTRFTYLPFGNPQNALVSSIMQVIGLAHPTATTVQSAVFTEPPEDHHADNFEDHQEEGSIASRLIPIAFCHASRIGDIPTLFYLVQDFEHMVNIPSEDGMVFLAN